MSDTFSQLNFSSANSVCKALTSITLKLSGPKYTVGPANNCVFLESELGFCQQLIDKESGGEIKKKKREEKVGEK